MQSRNFNPQHVEQLAMRLKQNGLVSSMTDAMTLAKSLTDANTSTSSYGSEKIPNPHATQQRRHPDGIDNLRREECAAPLAYLNRERRTPGRIENLPDHLQGRVCAVQMHHHEAPRSEPAVFQVRAPVVETPADDPYTDERAIKEILQQDAEMVYGDRQEQPAPAPAPVQAPAPVREEQPVIRPAQVVPPTPAPAPAPAPQSQEQPSPSEIPANHEGRGRGLSKEEAAITDISKIFYYGGR